MEEIIEIKTPLRNEDLERLKSGNKVLISGIIYTGRDTAHKKLCELIDKGEELPVDFRGQVIYFVGPSPAPPGRVIGSAGPTTSYRMDAYSPKLIAKGLKGMIGKGSRSKEVKDACVKYKCIYFAATGGAAALIAKSIISAKVVAYEDLGPEAINCLEVNRFPAIVVNDIYGNDLYVTGVEKYKGKIVL